MSITVKQVNDQFSGNPGNLIRRVVDTPAGQGIIRAVASFPGGYQAEVVTGRRARKWFSLNEISLVK